MIRVLILALCLAGCTVTAQAPVAEQDDKPCAPLNEIGPQLARQFAMRPVGLGGEGKFILMMGPGSWAVVEITGKVGCLIAAGSAIGE